MVNVISASTPQRGLPDEEKEGFWRKLDNEMERIQKEERMVLGADLSGNVGAEREGMQRIHREHGYRN